MQLAPSHSPTTAGTAAAGVVLVVDAPDVLSSLRDGLLGGDVQLQGTSMARCMEQVRDVGADVALLRLGLDGAAPVRHLRAGSSIGLLTIGPASSAAHRAGLLDAGADGHLDEPCDPGELAARLRALLRRCNPRPRALRVLAPGPDLVVDPTAREVRRGGRQVHLTGTELRLLEELIGNPGVLLSHEELLGRVWGEGYRDEVHYVRVYVGQLRRKLGDDARAPHLVQTVAGVGYRWIAPTSLAA